MADNYSGAHLHFRGLKSSNIWISLRGERHYTKPSFCPCEQLETYF